MAFSIPILLYHRIDATGSPLSTTPRVFRQHMHWLSARGWRSLSLDQFAFYARSGKDLPSRSFLLSFDDGYASLGTAAEVLKEFNFSAVCFLCTGLIRDPASSTRLDGIDNSGFLSWEEARALQQSGLFEFQSHTHSHVKSGDAPLAEVMQDLEISRDCLSQELRLPRSRFSHLAWPWGASREAWRDAAMKSGFRYQYTVARQAFDHESALQRMPRTCYDGASLLSFQTQFWLQVGPLADLWNTAYPVLRWLREPAQEAPSRAGAGMTRLDASENAS